MTNSVKLDDRILKQLIRQTPARLDTWLRGVSFEILADIVRSFGTSPSSPGEPPGVDTGNLRAGMGQDKIGDLKYIVYAQASYAPYLEFGSETMEKRPFFTPVFMEWRQRKLVESALSFDLVKV